MLVAALEVRHFRNLTQAVLQCSPGLNLIIGSNASGKTSLLEAVYCLGRARSFRTRQLQELIQWGADAFQIVATMRDRAGQRSIPIGLERSAEALTARIDSVPVRSLVQLATRVPVLLLNPDSHRLLEDGPSQRRRFMNWGVFHADQGFLDVWKRYDNALHNRNAALRGHFDNRVVDAWDAELGSTAAAIDRLRGVFCQDLEGALKRLILEIMGITGIEVRYHRGWSQQEELAALLRSNRDQDRRYGYTRNGPHRADFQVTIAGQPISERLSRGQQKLLVIGLVLAQAQLYEHRQDHPCILLIDDLPAELDPANRFRVMKYFAAMDTQFFITAIEDNLLDVALWRDVSTFRIDRGEIVAK